MKQIFDWLREQMRNKSHKAWDGDNKKEIMLLFLPDVEEFINEAEAKWESECCIRVVGKPFASSCGQKYDKWTYVGEPYCANCGKPIKISEVE